MTYDTDVQKDFTKEAKDGGADLNIRGAKKVSDWFTVFISQSEGIQTRNNEIYDKALEKYKQVRGVALLETEQDYNTYMSSLAENRENWIILMAVAGNYVAGLNENDMVRFRDLDWDIIEEGRQDDATHILR